MIYVPEHITLQQIVKAFTLVLPAELAHQKFLPKGRSLEVLKDRIPIFKESAVLFFLILKAGELHLCLTRRNSNLKHHPGQICFPGGMIDEDEQDSIKTALRELEEETGVDKKTITICGQLSDIYVSVSNFLIRPVVGFLDHEPQFKLNPHEVEEIILIPLKAFFDQKNHSESTVETSMGELKVPCYSIGEETIWGATAMIISEFTELLLMSYCQKE